MPGCTQVPFGNSGSTPGVQAVVERLYSNLYSSTNTITLLKYYSITSKTTCIKLILKYSPQTLLRVFIAGIQSGVSISPNLQSKLQ